MAKLEGIARYLPKEINDALLRCQEDITEIRIRRGSLLAVTVIGGEGGAFGYGQNRTLPLTIDESLMNRVLDLLCDHSLYSHMDTMVEGYIAVPEGFRVGVAGKAVCEDGRIKHLSSVSSVNIRVPRYFHNIAKELYARLEKNNFTKSVLLYSPPNMGKTTLLRDLVVMLTQGRTPRRVAVIDSRCEIETELLTRLSHVDILSGYPREKGIEIATRTLSPQYILCDEIGGYEEALSLLSAQNCGVPVVATAHASTVGELLSRRNIRLLHDAGLFHEYIGIRRLKNGEPPVFSFTTAAEVAGALGSRERSC